MKYQRDVTRLLHRVKQLEREIARSEDILRKAETAVAMCAVYRARNAELAEHNNQLRASLRYACQKREQ